MCLNECFICDICVSFLDLKMIRLLHATKKIYITESQVQFIADCKISYIDLEKHDR